MYYNIETSLRQHMNRICGNLREEFQEVALMLDDRFEHQIIFSSDTLSPYKNNTYKMEEYCMLDLAVLKTQSDDNFVNHMFAEYTESNNEITCCKFKYLLGSTQLHKEFLQTPIRDQGLEIDYWIYTISQRIQISLNDAVFTIYKDNKYKINELIMNAIQLIVSEAIEHAKFIKTSSTLDIILHYSSDKESNIQALDALYDRLEAIKALKKEKLEIVKHYVSH